jgi:hypothetical protein
MHPSRVRWLAATGFVLAFHAGLLEGQQGPWALVNARIETVTRGTIARGTILVRDGLIAAVGTGLTLPPDAVVIDLGGRTVSPGVIDLISSAGVPSRGARHRRFERKRGGSVPPGRLDPDRMVPNRCFFTIRCPDVPHQGITAILGRAGARPVPRPVGSAPRAIRPDLPT